MKTSYRQPNDTVTVDRSVLLTIARAAATTVEGVLKLGYASNRFNRMFGREPSDDGLRINVLDQSMTVDIYLIVKASYNLREISLKVQEEVSRTMEQMVGMAVQSVNVHIEDVVFDG